MAKNIVKVDQTETALATTSQEVAEMFGGNDTQDLPVGAVLPQISISRENPVFVMPDGEIIKSFEAHIIYHHNANQFFAQKFGVGESGPPQCYSSNGLTPDIQGEMLNYNVVSDDELRSTLLAMQAPQDILDDPYSARTKVWLNVQRLVNGETPSPGAYQESAVTTCAGCPANEYSSGLDEDRTAGKACNNSIWLYLVLDGYSLPCRLKAGPASLGTKESLVPFLTQCKNIGEGGKYQTVRTKFSLSTKNFSSGFSASVLQCQSVEVIQPGSEKMAFLAKMYKDFTTGYMAHIANRVATDKDE